MADRPTPARSARSVTRFAGGVAERTAGLAVRQAMTPARAVRRMRGGSLERAVRDKVVLVTGASSGIGEASARRLARAGAHVVLAARGEAELERVRAEIVRDGGVADVRVVDLRDLEAVGALAEELVGALGHVDVLVNNAGRSIRRPITESLERFHDVERTMQLNYFAPVRLTLALLPAMTARGDGHVVNISTWGTQTTAPLFTGYVASKAALEAWSRAAAAELRPLGVRFTTIHMPLVRTPMIAPSQKAYRGVPSLSAAEAAEQVAEAIATRPTRIGSRIGALAQAVDVVAPDLLERVMAGQPGPTAPGAGRSGGDDGAAA